MIYDAIIIGAGQAGLATGYHLQKAGLRFLILEAGDEPGGSWPYYYDSLHLNSTARYSALPGLPFPGQPDRYPSRDEVATYLRSYAAHFALPVVTGTRVTKVERIGRLFHLTTSQGSYQAYTVVAATGSFGRPFLPSLPGQTEYRGNLLHVADYRRPESYRQQRIVVVGGANAAVQIGVELAQVARVTLATHRPIRYLPQRILGQDIPFWLNVTGLERTQWLGGQSTPVYDTGTYRMVIAAGRPDRRPMFKYFTQDGVVWDDGSRETVDTVIFATGYQPNLAYLRGLGVLDAAGRPHQQKGLSTTVPGLYYVGLMRQRNFASATLRGVGPDARVVAAHLRRYCEARKRTGRRLAAGATVGQPGWTWRTRSSEFAGLMALITLALKQELAGRRLAAPRLLGEALVRSVRVGAGFLGFGDAAQLYSYPLGGIDWSVSRV